MEHPRFGTLVVVVDRARNLPNRKKIGKQDAYAIVRLGHEVQRTPTDKRAGQVPNWNHEVRFQVPSEQENILKISVFNEDHKVPDLIGDCAIDLSELYKKHEHDNWFDLKYKEKPAGEIYAELTFYYEGPPRPKPKVELSNLQSTGRPLSAGPAGRSLPTIPTAGEVMRAPVRQGTMSPIIGPADLPRPYDLVDGMNQLNMRQAMPRDDFGYTNSPYQQGVRYQETWNGERDRRVIPAAPAPGDVRRKSFSNDISAAIPANMRSADMYEASRNLQDSSPRRNSYVEGFDRRQHHLPPNLHRYAASQSSVLPERFLSQQQVGTRNDYYPHSPPAHQAPSSRQQSPTHMTRREDDPGVEYVEPILDPRHGSPYELRGSPSIVGTRPDYPFTESNTNLPTRRYTPIETDTSYRNDEFEADSYPPQTSMVGDMRRMNRHAQAQSMSYGPQQNGQQSQTYHNKASSTSAMASTGRSSFSPSHPQMNTGLGGVGGNYRAREARNSIDRSAHPYDVSQQRRNTYAATPAQYAATNRPLPVAPDAPPTLPAKIPLGLTQEEYDILYGR